MAPAFRPPGRPPADERPAEALPAADRAFVAAAAGRCPELAATAAVAARLARCCGARGRGASGTCWPRPKRTPLAGFAAGLRQDIEAVQAALELPWTTSPVEGQVNRLKMIKRSMYGRAGFQLLRQRVLHAA